MKILMVNKYHYLRGGSERYLFALTELLERHGHQLAVVSTRDPRNIEPHGEAHWLAGVDFDAPGGPLGELRTAARVVYSRPARRLIRAAVESFRPDVVHLHNIAHHFSPSILLELRRLGVPSVQTLHDFKLVCPTYRMLSGDRICERCAGGRYYSALLERCNRGSLLRSAVNVVESYLHAALGSYDAVDRFLCPSRFLLDKVAAFGVDAARLQHLPLFFDGAATPSFAPGHYAVFVGRLSPEKGLATLIAAAARSSTPLVVVGDGPQRAELEATVARQDLDGVRFTGHLDGAALDDVRRQAAFSVVPSEWYENFPLAVVESMALGKPVVASRLGGLAEMVDDGVTGRLVATGDVDAWAKVLAELASAPATLESMGRAARAKVEAEWSADRHADRLTDAYAAVTARAGEGRR